MKIRDSFLAELLEFMTEFADPTSGEITSDIDLIDSGVIDSLSINRILVFIEEKLNIFVSLEDLLLDSVRTARSIDNFYNVQR